MANSNVIGYLLKVKYGFAKLTIQLGTCYNSKIIKLSWQTQQDATHRLHPWTDFMSIPFTYVEILINIIISRAKINYQRYKTTCSTFQKLFEALLTFFYILNHRVDINSDIWWRSAMDRTFINLKMNFSGIIFFFTKFHCFWHLKFFENQTDSEKKA